METICIYHADCMDGAAAAAAVKHKYPEARLYPANHGEAPPPQVKDKRVFIVDFSYSAPLLEEIKKQAAEVNWYDHHKTAIPTKDKLGFGIIDLEESGATLTWKQLFPGTEVPKILQYVRDKDIWRWELPNSREISAAIREIKDILNPNNAVWGTLLKGPPESEWQMMIERGKNSRKLLSERLGKTASRGFAVELDGVKGFAVNWSGDSSELGEYIYQELGYPFALVFSYTGKEWSFSLRSKTIDVSEIALRRGGGGHPGAAGFRSPTIEWLMPKK